MSVYMNEHMKTHPDIQFNTEGWEVGVQTNSLTSHYHNPCKRFTRFRYSVEQSFCSPGDGKVDTGEGRLERDAAGQVPAQAELPKKHILQSAVCPTDIRLCF